ncbi:DUF1775 domain-containing protein [Arthrobacter alpinus]|nr:DUF1775 domain-containing protein [Arthrobacter alpinus]
MLVGLGSASAHVSATPSETAAGAYTLVTFAVGHGCDGSSTTSMTFTLPDELNEATPRSTRTGPSARPRRSWTPHAPFGQRQQNQRAHRVHHLHC